MEITRSLAPRMLPHLNSTPPRPRDPRDDGDDETPENRFRGGSLPLHLGVEVNQIESFPSRLRCLGIQLPGRQHLVGGSDPDRGWYWRLSTMLVPTLVMWLLTCDGGTCVRASNFRQ